MKSPARSSPGQLPMFVPNNLSTSGEGAAEVNDQANPQPKGAQPAAEKVGAGEGQREGWVTDQSGIAPGNFQQKRFCGLPHFF